MFKLSKRVKLLLANCWLSGRLALGRSTNGIEVGSYASLFSSAKMLLFLTRLACFKRSMLVRRLGETEGEGERSGVFSSKRKGDILFKPSGDVVAETNGELFSLYGEESRETIIF